MDLSPEHHYIIFRIIYYHCTVRFSMANLAVLIKSH